MNILKELVLDKGPDPIDWTADERREATVELLESDKSWLLDALGNASDNEYLSMIAALHHDNFALRHAALGIIVERLVINFCLDSLQEKGEQNLHKWLSEDRESKDHQEAYSKRTA